MVKCLRQSVEVAGCQVKQPVNYFGRPPIRTVSIDTKTSKQRHYVSLMKALEMRSLLISRVVFLDFVVVLLQQATIFEVGRRFSDTPRSNSCDPTNLSKHVYVVLNFTKAKKIWRMGFRVSSESSFVAMRATRIRTEQHKNITRSLRQDRHHKLLSLTKAETKLFSFARTKIVGIRFCPVNSN